MTTNEIILISVLAVVLYFFGWAKTCFEFEKNCEQLDKEVGFSHYLILIVMWTIYKWW